MRLIGAAICPKNTKTPKMVKDQLTSLLLPVLLNKSGEFLGEIVGSAIDPSFAKTDVGLTPKLVELLAADVLKAICVPSLRSAVKESSQDTFIEESLSALLSILVKEQPHSGKEGKASPPSTEMDLIFLTLLTADSGKYLLSLLDLLMNTSNEKVLMKLCAFLGTTLSSGEMGEKDGKKVVGILSKELTLLEELPAKLFSPPFLSLEPVVESVTKFFSTLITLGGKHPEIRVIPGLLSKTMAVVKQNVGQDVDKKINHLSAFEHVLQVIIQMAGLCEAEEGHAKLFQQMTEWLHDFTEDLEIQMGAAIESSATVATHNKSGPTERYPTLQAISTILEYMLDVGKTLQSVAASNPALLLSSSSKGGHSFQRLLERETTPGSNTPPNEVEDTFDLCDSEIGDDAGDDEESGGEDSVRD